MGLGRFYNSVAHSDGFEFEPCGLTLKEDRSFRVFGEDGFSLSGVNSFYR